MKLPLPKRKISLLGLALGSLMATSLTTGTAEAASIRSAVGFVGCAACVKALSNPVVVAKSDKVLTECAKKCPSGMEKLLKTLQDKQRAKQEKQEELEKDLKNVEKTINTHQGFINNPPDEASKRRNSKAQEKAKKEQKSLMKQNDKLAAEINKLADQIAKISEALGKKSPEREKMEAQPAPSSSSTHLQEATSGNAMTQAEESKAPPQNSPAATSTMPEGKQEEATKAAPPPVPDRPSEFRRAPVTTAEDAPPPPPPLPPLTATTDKPAQPARAALLGDLNSDNPMARLKKADAPTAAKELTP